MPEDMSSLRGPAKPGSISVNVAGAADVTLNSDQAKHEHIIFTGAITAAVNAIFPVTDQSENRKWTVENATTGLFAFGIKQPGGVALPVPQGQRMPVTFTTNGFRDANSSTAGARSGSRYIREQFQYQPIVAKAAPAGGAPTGTAGDLNVLRLPGATFEYHIKGTQTLVAPVLTAVGLDIGMDQTSTDGIELTHGITARCPVAFVVGTDPAFFVRAVIKVADASGANPLVIGFRKAEAYQALVASYADYAVIGAIGTANPNTIQTTTEAAGGGATTTDTTNTWADGATKELKVLVSAAGVVTYQINNAAPTTVAAFSFTAADVVVPFLFFLNAADVAGLVEIIDWEVGLQ
jgi:hypothetical protein